MARDGAQALSVRAVAHEAGTTTRRVYEKGVGLVGFEDLDVGWTAELVRP